MVYRLRIGILLSLRAFAGEAIHTVVAFS